MVVPARQHSQKEWSLFRLDFLFVLLMGFALRQPQVFYTVASGALFESLVRSIEVFEVDIRHGIDLVRFEHQPEPVFKSKSGEYSAPPIVRQPR